MTDETKTCPSQGVEPSDAARWRWCVEHPYEAMHILLEATNPDSYPDWPDRREPTLKRVRSYFVEGVDEWHLRGPEEAGKKVRELPQTFRPAKDEPQFLIAYGGDGADSRVVGESQLLDAYLAIVAGEDAEMRAECTAMLTSEDYWEMADNAERSRYRFHQSFEDGWLEITRIFEHPYKVGAVHSAGNTPK